MIDLVTGSRLGPEIPYNGEFVAAVVLHADQATVEITADGMTTRYPISERDPRSGRNQH